MNKLEALSAFCAVYKSGSFAKAAQRLNCSATMVSRYVKKLEDELGCLLIKRNTRNIQITDAGQQYFDQVSVILEQLHQADNTINEYNQTPSGKLKISSSIEFGSQYLPPVIALYKAAYPKVELDISLSNKPVDIWHEEIDLAFRVAPKLPEASFIAQPICHSRLALWASPDYLATYGVPHSIEELHQHQLLFFNHSLRSNQWIFQLEQQVQELVLPWSWRSNNGRILNEAAAQHQGIIQAPSYSVAPYVRRGELVEVLPQYSFNKLQISAVYPHRYDFSVRIKAFVETAKAYFAQHPVM